MRTEVEHMIQKRLNTATESEHIFKISKISIVNDSKRIYTLHVHARTIKRTNKM